MIRTGTMAAAIITFVAGAGTAVAQERSPAPKAQDPAANDIGVADIIVTANRRAESAQRSALSIQALSGDELARAGVKKVEDLGSVATGVSLAMGGKVPQVYIRGVGNYSTNIYSESAVAFNVDNVYVSRTWAAQGAFFDLDRVEVLKGPQGTLYGRNASGGAINILSARPRIGETTGYVEGEAGNHALFDAQGAINVGLGPVAALRASGQIVRRDGYLTDGYDDQKTEAARVHLLVKPTDDFSILLTGYYAHVGGNGPGQVLAPAPSDGSAWSNGAASDRVVAITRAQPFIGGRLMVGAHDGFVNARVYAFSGEFTWNLGPATLTVIPAYRDSQNQDRIYVATFRQDEAEADRQTTLEARLSNESARLKWVLGAYLFDEHQGNLHGQNILLSSSGLSATGSGPFANHIKSYAAFGQATLGITDRLRLTGGLRYTYERKDQNGSIFGLRPDAVCGGLYHRVSDTPIPGMFCRFDLPISGDLTYNNVTWKAGVEFDLTPQSLLYANASTGFKSGGYYAAPPPNSFRPEKLTAFDIGMKNRFLDNRLQLNVEAFFWRYRDHQESHLGATSVPGYYAFITENAGRATSYGADLDTIFQPTADDRLSLKVQYNKTRYDSFTYSYPTNIFGAPVVGCPVEGAPTGVQTINCSGFQLVRAPTWTGNVSYEHTFHLADGASLTAGVRGQAASGSYLSIDFLHSGYQKRYGMLDADLTFRSAGGRFEVAAWIRNITNAAVLTQTFRSPYVTSANPLSNPEGLTLGSIRPPRTFGIRTRVNF